jgi:hypothetical protein
MPAGNGSKDKVQIGVLLQHFSSQQLIARDTYQELSVFGALVGGVS